MYRFHHNTIDTDLFRQLQDLAAVLSGIPDLKFIYRFGSYIDLVDREVTASRTWDTAKREYQVAGLKTDIYLRTIGSLFYTDVQAMQQYVETLSGLSLSKFGGQLFALLEDIRLEERIKQERPGTKEAFSIRKSYLKHQFDNDRAAHVTRGLALDELFCLIYLRIQSDVAEPSFPRATFKQLEQLEKLAPYLFAVFEAKNTRDIARISLDILKELSANNYIDMLHDYFVLPISHVDAFSKNTLFDELTRTDPLENDDKEELDEDKNEYIDETFSTWHRENENSNRKQTFLQFELEVGTKTNMKGSGARETEDGDQAMGTIQGASGQTKNKDYSDLESLDKQENKQGKRDQDKYGEENKDAVKLIKRTVTPTESELSLYDKYVDDVEPYKRKLANILKKALEHKQNAPRKDIMAGRLSRKLLPIFLDEKPRIFYKKNEEAKEFDAAFTLLVDCSASMYGKMEETKRGIVLFHEVLKAFHIPHSIIGFWEDAMEVKEHYQPNYFHVIHSFADSFYAFNGPKIMQLEPQEDNRDGFSIRVATEELAARREKNKFLLVFSDGEPAAANYNQNGIVDTNLAVIEARKQRIEVIGTFLADGEIDELEDQLMQNIYGRERILVPNVAELPNHFAPLIKKLLLKTL
ncbi:vWA domain-containing protein [Virgibacillus pantothenticus]|uniref:vWA domain-containing protein n=1 Tax=Virgibacillus pantothenticus TaxID=1473 RepID=UPI000987202E|nr:VWA domain-containing protein [Virgibacillus pantothenticus]